MESRKFKELVSNAAASTFTTRGKFVYCDITTTILAGNHTTSVLTMLLTFQKVLPIHVVYYLPRKNGLLFKASKN